MTAKIIDGVAIAKSIRAQCGLDVQELYRRTGVSPGLAVILVGDDPASTIYVRNKIRACQEVGITSFKFEYARDIDPQSVLQKIAALNPILFT
jgi:methylenetetrahydrofolate dehydrogenase (NADP+) / methenyltetrahydrofolate cyclohydrolase